MGVGSLESKVAVQMHTSAREVRLLDWKTMLACITLTKSTDDFGLENDAGIPYAEDDTLARFRRVGGHAGRARALRLSVHRGPGLRCFPGNAAIEVTTDNEKLACAGDVGSIQIWAIGTEELQWMTATGDRPKGYFWRMSRVPGIQQVVPLPLPVLLAEQGKRR